MHVALRRCSVDPIPRVAQANLGRVAGRARHPQPAPAQPFAGNKPHRKPVGIHLAGVLRKIPILENVLIVSKRRRRIGLLEREKPVVRNDLRPLLREIELNALRRRPVLLEINDLRDRLAQRICRGDERVATRADVGRRQPMHAEDDQAINAVRMRIASSPLDSRATTSVSRSLYHRCSAAIETTTSLIRAGEVISQQTVFLLKRVDAARRLADFLPAPRRSFHDDLVDRLYGVRVVRFIGRIRRAVTDECISRIEPEAPDLVDGGDFEVGGGSWRSKRDVDGLVELSGSAIPHPAR